MLMKNSISLIVWSIFSSIIFLIICITYHQYKNYWQSTITRVQTVDFNILHATLPYAIAFLEENQKSDLIEHVLNSNYGFFSMVYTDMEGNIKFSTKPKLTHVKLNQSNLDQYQFSYVFKKPFAQQCSAKTPYADQAFVCTQKLEKEVDAYGKIYLLRREIPSFKETIFSRLNLESLGLTGKPIDDYVLNIVISMGFILFILFSGKKILKEIKKNERLIKQKHEDDRKILKLEMDGLYRDIEEKDRDIEEKEQSVSYKDELIEMYEVDNKSKDEEYFKLREDRDALKCDLSHLKDDLSYLKDKCDVLSSKSQQKEIEWSSIVQKDEFSNFIEFLWPKLRFEAKAIREMRKLYSNDRYSSKDICHALSFIEAAEGNFEKLKGPYIVKSWVDPKVPIIEIRFNPRRRIYVHSAKEKTHIVLIDPCKSKETESMAQKYLNDWKPLDVRSYEQG